MLTIFRVSPGLKHTIRLMSLAPSPVTSGLFPDSTSQLRQLNPTLYLQILCLSHTGDALALGPWTTEPTLTSIPILTIRLGFDLTCLLVPHFVILSQA